jgi:hypothetical protein
MTGWQLGNIIRVCLESHLLRLVYGQIEHRRGGIVLFIRDSLSSTINESMIYLIVEANGHDGIHDVVSHSSIYGVLSAVQSVENSKVHEKRKNSRLHNTFHKIMLLTVPCFTR